MFSVNFLSSSSPPKATLLTSIFTKRDPYLLLFFYNSSLQNMSCYGPCHCEKKQYIPTCGRNNITYYDPCHAGCSLIFPNKVLVSTQDKLVILRTSRYCLRTRGNFVLDQPANLFTLFVSQSNCINIDYFR